MSRIPTQWRGEVVDRTGFILWRGEPRKRRENAYRDAFAAKQQYRFGVDSRTRARACKSVDSEKINILFRKIR